MMTEDHLAAAGCVPRPAAFRRGREQMRGRGRSPAGSSRKRHLAPHQHGLPERRLPPQRSAADTPAAPGCPSLGPNRGVTIFEVSQSYIISKLLRTLQEVLTCCAWHVYPDPSSKAFKFGMHVITFVYVGAVYTHEVYVQLFPHCHHDGQSCLKRQ